MLSLTVLFVALRQSLEILAKVKYRYLDRSGERTFKTKNSAINFNKIRANQRVLFSVQGVTPKKTFGSIGKLQAQTLRARPGVPKVITRTEKSVTFSFTKSRDNK